MAIKIDQHVVLQQIKDLALELGRQPTNTEFSNRYGSRHHVNKHFGSWSNAIIAAGFTPIGHVEEDKRRIDNTIFEVKDINSFLSQDTAPIIHKIETLQTIGSISDIHWPFSNEKVIKRFYEYVGDEKPDVVVINGDAWDMYSHSKFPRSHNVFTPRDEMKISREKNEQFWKEIKKIHPSANCFQMLGNHDIRPMKRILEEYPEAEDWVKEKMKQLFSYDGVKTFFDVREELIIGNTAILHGYRTKLGDHRDFMLMNSINGHSHVGGVVFRQIKGVTLWELNSGFSGDPTAKGLTYTPQKITNWTPGFGGVNKYGPQFISCNT
jgi:predicted phosphodiesterase